MWRCLRDPMKEKAFGYKEAQIQVQVAEVFGYFEISLRHAS